MSDYVNLMVYYTRYCPIIIRHKFPTTLPSPPALTESDPLPTDGPPSSLEPPSLWHPVNLVDIADAPSYFRLWSRLDQHFEDEPPQSLKPESTRLPLRVSSIRPLTVLDHPRQILQWDPVPTFDCRRPTVSTDTSDP